MSKAPKLSLKELLCVVAALVLFFGLITASIMRSSVWHDEGYTATLVENNYGGIIERTALDVHPPLYYLVLKSWSYAFSDSVFSLRFYSAVCMAGAIIITWRIVRKLYGVRAGLVSLGFMAVGPFLVRYGQEMRMYGQVAFLASIATWLYLKTLETKKVSAKVAAAYGLTIAAGMYTQYFFVLVPMVHVIHALVSQNGSFMQRVVGLKKYVLSIIIAGVLFLPWLPTVAAQFKEVQGAFWIGPVGVETLTSTPIAMTLFNKQHEMTGTNGLLAVLALIVVIVLIRQFFITKKDKASRLLFMSVVLPPVLLFLLSVPPFQPSYQDRYMSFLAPIFYSVLALGALYMTTQKMRLVAFISLVLVLGHGQYANFWDGNNHGWKKPTFTMNDIIDQVSDNSPVYSTSLWTYFDAHITVKDRGMNNSAQFLIDKYPTEWKGNWSAIYQRPELIVADIPDDTQSFWLIDESGPSMYSGQELNQYIAGESKTIGYAKITKYSRL